MLDETRRKVLDCCFMADKKLPQISKRQINRAGDVLRGNEGKLTSDVIAALGIVGDWRTSHAYPLQCVYMKLRERAKRIEAKPKPLVYQRLKRFPSIIYKLQRNPNMALTTIQDIGGCRAVLSDIKSVRKLASKMGAITKDYISNPKPDGYRSIHLVDQYVHMKDSHEEHSGRRIEIQLRTRLQHAWATAIETVDSTLQQNIKGGGGDKAWRRFFALASCVIALHENAPEVPGCPKDRKVLFKELRTTAEKLDVFSKLDGLSSSIQYLSSLNNRAWQAYILVLDMHEKKTEIIGFTKAQLEFVAEEYLEREKKHFGDPRFQVVQVFVENLRELKRAYPNYYLDTQAFGAFLINELYGK